MAGPTPGLPLSLPPAPEARSPGEDAPVATPCLWLALVFPRLALEVLASGTGAAPIAATEQAGGRRRVHTASRAAEARGVTAGMPVNAAYALCPALQVREIDEQARRMRLAQLARWAGRYTSQVSPAPPQALLLEIRGSLRLFGGLDQLHGRITRELAAAWAHEFHCAVAPAPAAALLLAENRVPALITGRAALRSALGPLPVEALPLEPGQRQRLTQAGIRILRDLWRLPAAGLARRFGPELTDYLERALGRRPDPRVSFTPAKRFQAALALPGGETRDHGPLLAAARRLIDELIDFLRARDAATDHCLLRLHHHGRAPTEVHAGLREPARDGGRLLQVVAEHLQRLRPEAPVTAVELITERLQAHTPASGSLLQPSGTPDASGPEITALLEQLQARLGRTAVRGLHVIGDVRPEHTTAEYTALFRPAGLPQAPGDRRATRRPLWLLPRPRRLGQHRGRPRYPGALRIGPGPERIEGGWWDGGDVRRDYYIASNEEGRRLWIFRDLRDGQWYLHGLFG